MPFHEPCRERVCSSSHYGKCHLYYVSFRKNGEGRRFFQDTYTQQPGERRGLARSDHFLPGWISANARKAPGL